MITGHRRRHRRIFAALAILLPLLLWLALRARPAPASNPELPAGVPTSAGDESSDQ